MTTLKKILSIILILLLFNVFAFPVFAENGAPNLFNKFIFTEFLNPVKIMIENHISVFTVQAF